MNYRLLGVTAIAVGGLTLAPAAGAYMSMFGSYPGDLTQFNASPRVAGRLVSMDAALRTAENQVAGKAFSAELKSTETGPVYLIEFAGKGTNSDVWVDARSGKVEKTETTRLATFAPGE